MGYRDTSAPERVRLNLGCGRLTPAGWTNVDYALGARLFKIPLFRALNRRLRLVRMDWDPRILIHDLRRPFPFADGSVDVVYSSHTLEHFAKEEGRRFLGECHRVLRPGGILRVLVPDLKAFIAKYEEGRFPADDFVAELGVLPDRPRRGLFGSVAGAFAFPHKCMYDTAALLARLDEIGFDAAAKPPFESAIEDIENIEAEGRTTNSVIVEGVRRGARHDIIDL